MKRWLSIGGLILVTVIWGGGFVASDIALESMEPFQIMTVRFLLASVLMGLMSIPSLRRIEKGELKAGILMGIALFAAFSLQIIGLQYTTPSKNAFLTALNVVIVPFIAFLVLKKKIGWKEFWERSCPWLAWRFCPERGSDPEPGGRTDPFVCRWICLPDFFHQRVC